MIERLTRYVSIKSLSREERELADAIAADLESAGLTVRRAGNNVGCEIGDAPAPRLLLNSHLDTVPAGDGWQRDPWTPIVEDGRLIGLGANDAKGCAVAMIEAALAINRNLKHGARLGGTVVLALTAEEEISGDGLSAVLDDLGPLDAALVGEPTALVPMTAQRGLLILKAVARGRSGHPAHTQPATADNAILAAADDLRRLAAFDWGPPHPLLGRAHAHATRIHGGVANNVIPDACEFLLDVRTTPSESHPSLAERLRAHLSSEISLQSDRLVPVETSPDEPIVGAVLRALPGTKPTGSPAMSDMVFLANIPAVKIGPGRSERSHTPNEFILIEELRSGAAAYERIIREFFNAEARR